MLTRLTIAGMSSVHAVRAVFTALGGVDGVTRADVSLGSALVEHDGRATVDAMRAAVELAGCELSDATDEKRQLPIL